MEYGLLSRNDYGSVTISSSNKVMVFSERGTFTISSSHSDTAGYGSFTFLKPIKSVEPPQVFLRVVSGTYSSLSVYALLQGTPGNWTGCAIQSGAGAVHSFAMEYVLTKFADVRNTLDFGEEVSDANGNVVFSSSDRVVRYGKFTKNWTKVPGAQVDFYLSGLVIDADDFISITSIDRGVSWLINYNRYVALRIRSNNAPDLQINCNRETAGGNQYWQGTNGTCFSIPVCKFPIDRYHN